MALIGVSRFRARTPGPSMLGTVMHTGMFISCSNSLFARPIPTALTVASWGGARRRDSAFSTTVRPTWGLPYAPQSPSYTGCGVASSLSIREGLSVGWGDKYGSNLAYQWIKINGLRDGL